MPHPTKRRKLHSRHVHGQVRGTSPTGRLVIYTDGSVSGRSSGKNAHLGRGIYTGWGYLATDGHYGCGTYPQDSTLAGADVPAVTELRAVWHAIAERLATTKLTIILDSRVAKNILTDWLNGSTKMPPGYLGSQTRTSTLELLRQLVVAHANNLTMEHVKGHNGDILNEGADTLALIGLRWNRDNLENEDAHARAHRTAEGFLTQWRLRQ